MSDPRFLPEGFEPQLAHLVEECGEVISAAGKTLRYGRTSVNPTLPPEAQEENETWLVRELQDLKDAASRLEITLGRLPAPPLRGEYRLYWAGEESEVYAARSRDELRSYLAAKLPDVQAQVCSEVYRDAPCLTSSGEVSSLYREFRRLAALSGPVQISSRFR